MATRYPSEFRRQAVELVRLGEQPIRKIAADLGVSDQTLRNWIKQIDIDEGRRGGLTTEERAEMVIPESRAARLFAIRSSRHHRTQPRRTE